jgi:hypothetical protein
MPFESSPADFLFLLGVLATSQLVLQALETLDPYDLSPLHSSSAVGCSHNLFYQD